MSGATVRGRSQNNDITRDLKTWDIRPNTTIEEVVVNGQHYARICDEGNNFEFISNTGNLALTEETTVCLKIRRDTSSTANSLAGLRQTMPSSNISDFRINLETGDHMVFSSAGIALPTVNKKIISDNHIYVEVTFSARPDQVSWIIFPSAWNLAGDPNANLQGCLDIESIEFDCAKSEDVIQENTPSRICLPTTVNIGSGGIGAGEPDIQLQGYLIYTEESVFTRFAGADSISGVQEANFFAAYYDSVNSTWRYSDNGQNGSAYLTTWLPFTPQPTDVIFADVILANGANGGSVVNGPTIDGVINGINSTSNFGGLITVNGNQFTNGSTNNGEFHISGTFLASTPDSLTACLELDGTYTIDSDQSTLTVANAIADGWVGCKQEVGESITNDGSATVETATTAFISTNGIGVAIGEDYIEFSNGETWAQDTSDVEACPQTIERTIVDSSLTAGADFSYIPASAPFLGATPSLADIEGWISTNDIYNQPSVINNDVHLQEQFANGVTDGAVVEFWVTLTASTTLDWGGSNASFLRIEVDPTGTSGYTIASEIIHPGPGFTSQQVTLPAGLYKIRVTLVDFDGGGGSWFYNGPQINPFSPASGAITAVTRDLLLDCDGNYTELDGSPVLPVTGDIVNPASYNPDTSSQFDAVSLTHTPSATVDDQIDVTLNYIDRNGDPQTLSSNFIVEHPEAEASCFKVNKDSDPSNASGLAVPFGNILTATGYGPVDNWNAPSITSTNYTWDSASGALTILSDGLYDLGFLFSIESNNRAGYAVRVINQNGDVVLYDDGGYGRGVGANSGTAKNSGLVELTAGDILNFEHIRDGVAGAAVFLHEAIFNICKIGGVLANPTVLPTLTDNSDGTYSGTDGIDDVDTRASSNPYDPSSTNLSSTNVGDALDELANANRGWRSVSFSGAQITNDFSINSLQQWHREGSISAGSSFCVFSENQFMAAIASEQSSANTRFSGVYSSRFVSATGSSSSCLSSIRFTVDETLLQRSHLVVLDWIQRLLQIFNG